MEMHQVRYFLAVARLLHFTRAAEECNVTQPSLTRAIKQLEAELGGDLFRRERPSAQLTELGERMHPLLKQCYDAAAGARSLASSFKSGEIGTLRIALADSVDLAVLLPVLEQLQRQFNKLEFRFLRGSSRAVADHLKNGEAELGIAAEISETWDRLDVWPLFTEDFDVAVSDEHRLATQDRIAVEELGRGAFLSRSYCEHDERLRTQLRDLGVEIDRSHDVHSERDLIALVEAGVGIGVVPQTTSLPATLRRAALEGLDARRTIHLYGVAGRERTAVASAVMRILRGRNWQQWLAQPH
ncbi:LysR family transcriptional regulator [Bradyrhizobium sp. ORS 375]|uniref:LysR family transcriptional regulator n=1 Tax=Bradyrhizobium sp. (strain ORS 375) TaxID=566679 RepID=UPI00031CE558|nr:LysR family transcriptional regulator [Bradyrhizobium sp. ORS 375]